MIIAINFVVDITESSLVNDGNYPIVSSFEDFGEFKKAIRSEDFCTFVEVFSEKVGVPKDFLYLYCPLSDGNLK